MFEPMTQARGLDLIDATLLELDTAPHELHMELLDELINRALDYKDQRTDDMAEAEEYSRSAGSSRRGTR